MKKTYAFAAALFFGALLSDYGVALPRVHQTFNLVESSGPTSGGRDTALYADAESNSSPVGGHGTALYADGESSGPSSHGRDSALA